MTPNARSPRLVLVLAAAAAALGLGSAALAEPPPPPARPVWPVANPSFDRPDFRPSTNDRQLSGVFGPRLKWGDGRYDHHEGFDFFAFWDPAYPRGDHPVRAILPGVVTEIIDPPDPERTETGRKVVITHDVPWNAYGSPREWGPVKSGYLHLSHIAVRQGQRVELGEELGRAGDTGYTSTVHLHLNLYRPGGRDVNVNPARVFSPRLFPAAVAPLDPRTTEVEWLELDPAAGTALVRVLLPHNAYTLDGIVLAVERDDSRAISFEQVSAERRDQRDTGDADLVPGLRLFPLRYNGGGTVDSVNDDRIPAGWPMARHRVPGGKGVRLGFDLLATHVPAKARKFELTLLGVCGERVTARCPGFQSVVGAGR